MLVSFKPGDSLKGQLLLDGGRLHGSWFHRAVVLICQHDAEGAFGLVLNRPAPTSLVEALPVPLPERLTELPLRVGGPVQPGALSFLHSDLYLPQASVLPNLDLGHSLEDLIELGSSFSTTRRLLVFAGYAGWSAGQLDDEMAREAWLVSAASADSVFDPEPDTLWRRIVKSMGMPYCLLADAPEDWSLN
jgi:putative transcriptional regulator